MSSAEEEGGFMEAQKKINELHTQGIQEVKNLLGTLLQSTRNSEAEKSAEPAAKKRKRDDEGVTSETGVGIQLHVQDHERIEDEMVEEDEWNQLNGNGPLGGGIEGEGNHNEASQLDGDGTMSANLGSKYQDLLDQTEEVLGEPINKDLADVVKRVWGKSVLTSEKKKRGPEKTAIQGSRDPSKLSSPQITKAQHESVHTS